MAFLPHSEEMTRRNSRELLPSNEKLVCGSSHQQSNSNSNATSNSSSFNSKFMLNIPSLIQRRIVCYTLFFPVSFPTPLLKYRPIIRTCSSIPSGESYVSRPRNRRLRHLNGTYGCKKFHDDRLPD